MLHVLPSELLTLVVKQVETKADLAALCRVSSRLEQITRPILYRSITIRIEDDFMRRHSLEKLAMFKCRTSFDGQSRYRDIELLTENLIYTKTLLIKTPFLDAIEGGRCNHDHPGDGSYRSNDPLGFNDFLGQHLAKILEGLRDDSLLKFSWELGTCAPPHLLGSHGYLTLRQRNIQHLSLVTDGNCPHLGSLEGDVPGPILSSFTSLHTLSWRGLRRKNEFLSVSDCLRANSKHLRKLLLDSVQYIEAYAQIQSYCGGSLHEPSDVIERFLPDLKLSIINKVFPNLQSLTLSGLPIKITSLDASPTMDISRLHTLVLRNCVHMGQLLQSITCCNESIHLNTLELTQDGVTGFDTAISIYVSGFLTSFRGLKSLYILLNDPDEATWCEIVVGVMHHCSSLKRLVLHERACSFDENRFDMDLTMDLSERKQLCSLDLDFLGTSDSIDRLLNTILGTKSNSSIQILHLRSALNDFYDNSYDADVHGQFADLQGEEGDLEEQLADLHPHLIGFAQAAFAPDGLPSLKILAYGDFSFGRRYSDDQIFLCRANPKTKGGILNFRELLEEDEGLHVLLQKNMEALKACPVDTLFHYTADIL